MRKSRGVEAAVTEHTQGASSRIGICPRVVSLEKPGRNQRISVRVFNMSAKILDIKPDSQLCELHEVKVLRSIDPVIPEKQTAAVNQQTATRETTD